MKKWKIAAVGIAMAVMLTGYGDASVFCQFIAEQVLENERDMMRMLHIPLQQAHAIEP